MGLQVQSEPTAEEHSKDVLYTIKKDPIVGRYMVASRDIEPGESIFSDDPVAVGKTTQIYTNITNQSIRIYSMQYTMFSIITSIYSKSGPDNSSKPLCLGCMTRKVNGSYLCRDCNWPMCSNICAKSSNHIEECKLLKSRGSKIKIPWFDKPCSYYDAILPLRVMLLQKTNPKAYNLISILMDHSEGIFLIREILNIKTVIIQSAT